VQLQHWHFHSAVGAQFLVEKFRWKMRGLLPMH
jgi:hypothetical protein